jgi:NADH dehydrogenase FAD-containing subunit
MPDYPHKKLIIAGGGHASLPLIKMGHHWKKKNLTITLVSAEPYLVYSGALPQYMGGFYEWHETAINLKQLCERYGVEFVRARVESVDSHKQLITMETGQELGFNYLVINVGATTKADGKKENIYPVKPMSRLLRLKEKLESGLCQNLLIIGGGVAGTEIAFNLSHPDCRYQPQITIIEKNRQLLEEFPMQVSKIAMETLKKRGVNVRTGAHSGQTDAENFDAVILATGNEPESINISHPFPLGSGNRILTDRTLLIKGYSNVFAAGDTADVNGTGLPQIGIHAVKQGVTLRTNIEALVDGKPMKNYSPYPVNPLIISDGPNRALYIINKLMIPGKISAVLKYVLDMKWLEKYNRTPESRRSITSLVLNGFKRAE